MSCARGAFVAQGGGASIAVRLNARRTLRATKRKRPRVAGARVHVMSVVGYVPSEDDRPEGVPKVPTELTLSQQLLLRQYEDQVERMTTKDCQELALEVARQMMVKDNVLRTMLKKDVPFGADAPEPNAFRGTTDDKR